MQNLQEKLDAAALALQESASQSQEYLSLKQQILQLVDSEMDLSEVRKAYQNISFVRLVHSSFF